MNEEKISHKPEISERLRLVLEQLESVIIFDKNSGENTQENGSEHISAS